MKHTKWIIDLEIDIIFQDDGHVESLIEITNEDHSETIGYTASNAYARLIASAPELFEASRQLLDRLDFHGSIDIVREEGPIEDLRQVISKIEGRT